MTHGEISQGRVRFLSALVVLAVFGAGVAAGFGLFLWRAPGAPKPRGGLDLRPPSLEALGLSREQEAKAHEIGERYRPEIEEIRREVAPRIRTIHERMREEMEAYLSPAQRALQDAALPPLDPADDLGRDRPHPPREALDACAGKSSDAACSFAGPKGTVTGTCRNGPRPEDPLACAPPRGPAF